MNGDEVRKLTDEEISIEIRNLRSKLHTLRTLVVTEKVEDVSAFRQHRRDVARLLTERNARLLASGKRKSKRRGAAGEPAAAAPAPVKAGAGADAKAGAKASARRGTKAAKAGTKK